MPVLLHFFTENIEMTSNPHIHDLLIRTRALQKGHFRLVSGLHSEQYFQCALLFQKPSLLTELFDSLASPFKDSGIEYTIGIEETGSIIAFEVAKRLDAEVLFARRREDSIALLPAISLPPKSRVLILDDVTTTGGTIKQLLKVVKEHGGIPSGVGLIASKGSLSIDLHCKLNVLAELDMPAIESNSCSLCQQGIPLSNA